jgi:phosphatidate cytidylyltransferase
VVLIPFVIWATFRGGWVFAAAVAVAGALMASELIRMFGAGYGLGGFYGVLVAGAIPFSAELAEPGGLFPSWGSLALALATVVLLILFLFRRGPPEEVPRGISVVALSWLYCGLLLASAVGLRRQHGYGWVFLAFIVTWVNDTFAYFTGHVFGRHKLFPGVSPKKTWEGFLGGTLGSLVGGAVGWWIFLQKETSLRNALLIGAGGALLGPLGDLVESMIKRSAGVKDASNMIPGHGGVLDRVDSLLFVAPWVYLFASYLR